MQEISLLADLFPFQNTMTPTLLSIYRWDQQNFNLLTKTPASSSACFPDRRKRRRKRRRKPEQTATGKDTLTVVDAAADRAVDAVDVAEVVVNGEVQMNAVLVQSALLRVIVW